MAHLTARNSYQQLVERLNRFPAGRPAVGHRSTRSCGCCSRSARPASSRSCPSSPSPPPTAARAWKMPEAEATGDPRRAGRPAPSSSTSSDATARATYVLPAADGRLLRVLDDARARRHRPEAPGAAVLPVPERRGGLHPGPVRRRARRSSAACSSTRRRCRPNCRCTCSTTSGRARWPNGRRTIGVSLCYCRHKMQHVGQACDAPMDICMTFNTVAASLVRHGAARAVDAAECLDLLQQARGRSLVQFGENVARDASASSATAAAAAARR